jgi:hypothetical protein
VVEGLVSLTGRDGSTPFSRIENPRKSGGFRVLERLVQTSQTQADPLGRASEISIPGHENDFLIA